MIHNSLNKQNTKKKIIAIFFSLILGIALSFGLFTHKARAEDGKLDIDFIVATTDIRGATSYINDTTTRIYKENATGSIVKWAVDKKYYDNLSTADGSNFFSSATINLGAGDVEAKFIHNNAYYDNNSIKDFLNENSELYKNKDDGYYPVLVRYKNEPGEPLNPLGNYVKVYKHDGTVWDIEIQQDLSNVKNIKVNTNTIKLLRENGNDKYIEIDNVINKTYIKDYVYGYNYETFNGDYTPINSDNSLEDITYVGYNAETGFSTSNKAEYNKYLMYPTTDGDGEWILFNGGWKKIGVNVKYCYEDGSIDDTLTAHTHVLLHEDTDSGLKIWAKLGTSDYYHSSNDNPYPTKVANVTSKLYAYKVNYGLFIKVGEEYRTLSQYNKISNDEYTPLEIREIYSDRIITNDLTDLTFNQILKLDYYYDIYKAIHDPNSDEIIGYQYYTQDLKAQANYQSTGDNAFINTYFADDKLEDLYYFVPGTEPEEEDKYVNVFKEEFVNVRSISSNETSDQILLNNYTQQENLYITPNEDPKNPQKIENIYLSFGDMYHETKEDNQTILTSLEVKLEITNNCYSGSINSEFAANKELMINDVINQAGVVSDGNEEARDNNFWFQYLDLRNLRTKDGKLVEDSAGRYDLTINYNYYNIKDKKIGSGKSFTYTFYVDELSNKVDYPLLTDTNNDNLNTFALNKQESINYYYNFQKSDIPQITFDASEYGLDYTYNYGQDSLGYKSKFMTANTEVTLNHMPSIEGANNNNNNNNVTSNNKIIEEIGVFDFYKYQYVNNVEQNVLSKRYKISATANVLEKIGDGGNVVFDGNGYDKIAVIEYNYYSKEYAKNENTSNDYMADNFGTFYEKRVQVVLFKEDDDTYTYRTYSTSQEVAKDSIWISYKLENGSYVTTVSVPNNFDLIDDSGELPISGFKAEKYQDMFDKTYFDFEYIMTFKYEELGMYEFTLKYVTSDKSGDQYIQYTKEETNTDIFPVTDEAETNILEALEREYRENAILGKYRLDIIGVKSYFNKYDNSTNTATTIDFRQVEEGIYSDLTPAVNERADRIIDSIKKGYTLEPTGVNGEYISIAKVPNTNIVPIKFEYLCLYNYASGAIPISKIYRYKDFVYNKDGTCTVVNYDNCEVSYFDKNSKPHLDGYYEIVIEYTYSNGDAVSVGAKNYQVFAFVIDNSAPDVTYNTLKETIVSSDYKYAYWENMEQNIYTNSPVRASWRTANYFQYEVLPVLKNEDKSSNTNTMKYDELTLQAGKAYDFSTEKYKIRLAVNSIISSSGAEPKEGATPEDLLIYEYLRSDKVNQLSMTPLFKISIVDGTLSEEAQNLYEDWIENRIMTVSNFYNDQVLKAIEAILDCGASFEFVYHGYQWEMIVYPSKTYTYLTEEYVGSTGYLYGDGLYSLQLTYGSNKVSNITSRFVIDTQPITPINTKHIMYDSDTYSITYDFDYQTLINDRFTITYNQKESGASISTYYYTIPFSSSNNSAINLYLANDNKNDNKIGISVSQLVNYLDTKYSRKTYNYNYDYTSLGDLVPYSNVLSAPESALFLFVLQDAAGNMATYYVIYDLTNPNYSVTLGSADLDENGQPLNYFKQYNIITDMTELFWGNYKSIEVTPKDASGNVQNLDLKYIFKSKLTDINHKNHINYTPTILEQILRSIVNNYYDNNNQTDPLLRPYFTMYWNIKDKNDDSDAGKWEEVYYVDNDTRQALLDSYSYSDKIVKLAGGDPEVRYFINIPLANAQFEYTATNSNDDFTKNFSYNLAKSGAKNGTVLSPTKKKLIDYWELPENSDVSNVEAYGFYGENKYYYTISDILGNSSGDFLWMNLDKTLAFAWGVYTNSQYDINSPYANSLNLKNITPNSTTSASQLYFSFIPSDSSNNIPDAHFDYKHYNFALDDNNIYSDYYLSDIVVNTDNEENYDLIFKNNNGDKKTITIDTFVDENNKNADGEIVSEKKSTYPFELKQATWNPINYSINNTDVSKNFSTYKDINDNSRQFTNLINAQGVDETQANEKMANGIYSSPGLYVFRRVYTTYVNEDNGVIKVDPDKIANGLSELGDDQAVRYYVYYIDRYSIIDISNLIGKDISLIFGDYVNTAIEKDGQIIYNENYKDKVDDIFINSKSSAISNNYASKNFEYRHLDDKKATKGFTSFNIPIDKYNQTKYVNKYKNNFDTISTPATFNAYQTYLKIDNDTFNTLSDEQKAEKKKLMYEDILQKYLFNINSNNWLNSVYYNSQFLLKVNMGTGSEGVSNVINDNTIIGKQYIYQSNKNNTTPLALSNASSRLNLTNDYDKNINAIIFKDNLYYRFTVKDQSGFDKKQGTVIVKEGSNQYTFTLGLNTDQPNASILVKSGNENDYDTYKSDADYAVSLFNQNGDITRLQTLSSSTSVYDVDKGYYIKKYTNTNSQSLIFLIDNTTITNFKSATNPYNIEIIKTPADGSAVKTIFKTTLTFKNDNGKKEAELTYDVSKTSGISETQMKKAFISNASVNNGVATKWAIVVYDNLAYDKGFENLLSNASDNATYNMIVTSMGDINDYGFVHSPTGSETKPNTNFNYRVSHQVTVDHIKPIYNLITLMENDAYIDKTGINLETYGGHKYINIQTYYQYLLNSKLSTLNIQYWLNKIYEAYLAKYKTTNVIGDSYTVDIKDKYGDTNTYFNNYYFAINEKNISNTLQLITTRIGLNGTIEGSDTPEDAKTMYIKRICNSEDEIDKITDYKFSLTQDDFSSNTGITDTNGNPITNSLVSNELDSATQLPATLTDNTFYILNSDKFHTIERGIYEIIEKDAAGNYRVYLINVNPSETKIVFDPDSVTNSILEEKHESGYINKYVANSALLKTETIAHDFIKAKLTYSFIVAEESTNTTYVNYDQPIYIYNRLMENKIYVHYNKDAITNPIDIDTTTIEGIKPSEQIEKIVNMINGIVDGIANTYSEYALDFEFKMTFYTRFGESREFTFIRPGKKLELDINQSFADYFIITVPEDMEGRNTKIMGISVASVDGAGGWTAIATDAKKKSFSQIDKEGRPVAEKNSLGGESYMLNYLGNSPYRIKTIDNFNQIHTIYVNKPNSVLRDIQTKNVLQSHGENYTANDIIVKYQSSLYNVVICVENADDNTFYDYYNVETQLDDPNSKNPYKPDVNKGYSINRTQDGDGLLSLTIHQEMGYENKFHILIIDIQNSDIDNLEAAYDKLSTSYHTFENADINIIYEGSYGDDALSIYTKIPEIQLLNTSGIVIASSKDTTRTVFIEEVNFRLYNHNDYKFSPKASVYINNVLTQTGVTSYTFDTNGTYIILVSNELGYTSTLYFDIDTTNAISDYSVFTNDKKLGKITRLDKSSYSSNMYYWTQDEKIKVELLNKDNIDDAYEDVAKTTRLYYYYANSEFYDRSDKVIEIITNTNNQVEYELIQKEASGDFGQYQLYRVYDKITKNTIEFFVVQFVEDSKIDFSQVEINTLKAVSQVHSPLKSYNISYQDNKIYVIFGASINNPNNNSYLNGNVLYLNYYYNSAPKANISCKISDLNKFTVTVKDNNNNDVISTYYYLELSATGVHKFEINDMAGNKCTFGTGENSRQYLQIDLINSILYQINGEEPIPNFITNDPVVITLLSSIDQKILYELGATTVKRNGLTYEIEQSNPNEYTFTEAGTYELTVNATNNSSTSPYIMHTIEFTIVNPNVAYNSYAISSAKGFTILSVKKKLDNAENSKVTNLPVFAGLNNLFISCEDDANGGRGYYTITLSQYLDSIKAERTCEFTVWLNNRNNSAIIIPSIPFGTETTDVIVLQYNPSNIYKDVGESFITINDKVVETITADSLPEFKSIELTEKGDYWIKIVSANGQILASYKLTKNEPLNATAKIIIIIAVITVIVLVVIFIILRKKVKFR